MDFAARLLAWFEAHRRDLPWRRTRDPWSIWVSEVMLQQTRVAAVCGAYERFLERFPTPAAFASADDDELMRSWRGLGYYRRARLLRDGARAVVAEHAGRVPNDPEALGRLPGIGDYTRGAIASIAFDRREPAVDGNVQRVAARHRGITAAIESATARRAILAFAEAHLPATRAGDFNQALMELGATVCTPTSPRCEVCPVRADCVAHAEGRAAELPARKPRRPPVEVGSRAVLVRRGAAVLGARVPSGEPNEGQVELPGAGVLVTVGAADLPGVLRTRYGAAIAVGAELARIRHAITHHRITFAVHAGELRDRGVLAWFPSGDGTPWTTPARKSFAAAVERA